jgi:hypothetical protein
MQSNSEPVLHWKLIKSSIVYTERVKPDEWLYKKWFGYGSCMSEKQK